MPRRLFTLFVILACLSAFPASAFEWEYLSMDGAYCTCIETDPIHDRVYAGTLEGFHYLDQPSGDWTNRDWEGWIGRAVWSIQWHPAMDQRVITGRENAFFKGYVEFSDDLGATETLAYMSNGGGVADLDYLQGGSTFACTWPDVAPGEFLRSDDSGETWTLFGGHGHYAMTAVVADMNNGAIYLAGDNRVTRSWDFGETWEFVGGDLPPAQLVHCIEYAFPGGDIITPMSMLAGNDIGLYYSETGVEWERILTAPIRRVEAFPGPPSWPGVPDYIAVVTWDGRVLLSRGGWGNWTDETGDLPGQPVDIAHSPYDDGLYVCTEQHGVYRVQDVVTATESAPAALIALDAWPNPFNPKTTLRFDLAVAGTVTLDVFDAAGRRVGRLLRESLPAGRHELEWDATGLPSGVYLANLRTVAGTQRARLVLLK